MVSGDVAPGPALGPDDHWHDRLAPEHVTVLGALVSGVKSTYMISATGRSPAMAAPTAAPPIVASEIGVSRTRSSPNSSNKPRVAPYAPPYRPTSSPMTNTLGSRIISSRKDSWMACQ